MEEADKLIVGVGGTIRRTCTQQCASWSYSKSSSTAVDVNESDVGRLIRLCTRIPRRGLRTAKPRPIAPRDLASFLLHDASMNPTNGDRRSLEDEVADLERRLRDAKAKLGDETPHVPSLSPANEGGMFC